MNPIVPKNTFNSPEKSQIKEIKTQLNENISLP